MRRAIAAGLIAVASSCASAPAPDGGLAAPVGADHPGSSGGAGTGAPTSGRVIAVVDGDSLDVVVGDVGERVRLIGIDAPEMDTCRGRAAAAAMGELVVEVEVVLVSGVNHRDRYGRLLRFVDRAGVDVGLALIAAGHGVARYDDRDGYPSHARQDAYRAADAASPASPCAAD